MGFGAARESPCVHPQRSFQMLLLAFVLEVTSNMTLNHSSRDPWSSRMNWYVSPVPEKLDSDCGRIFCIHCRWRCVLDRP